MTSSLLGEVPHLCNFTKFFTKIMSKLNILLLLSKNFVKLYTFEVIIFFATTKISWNLIFLLFPYSNKPSHVPSALASVASLEELQGSLPPKCSPRSMQTSDCILGATSSSSRSPLPGENLPEHHFKKRYFKTESSNQNRGQDSATPTSNISSASKTRNGSPSNSSASPTISNRE